MLWVVGESPIADALVELSGPLGFVIRRTTDSAGPVGATAVVVSSHGRDEEASIRAALDACVGYIGLVASRRRGQAVIAELGLSDEERSVVRSPAGMDIGARSAPEIALSVLAEIVGAIRRDGLAAAPTGADGAAEPDAGPARPETAVDPLCGMTIVVGDGTPHLVVHGEDHWFCSDRCRVQYAQTLER